MSNEALIAYYLISKQHFNHAKTRVQFDLTIRIVIPGREGGGCLDFRLVEVLAGPARYSRLKSLHFKSSVISNYCTLDSFQM